MIRRISTKWLLAVLAAVVVPFVGFAWYVDLKLADRLSRDIVRYYMQRFAADLAERIDDELEERRLDIEQLAEDPFVIFSLGEDPEAYIPIVELTFDRIVARKTGFDLLLVVDAEGRCIGVNSFDSEGRALGPERVADLHRRDYSKEDWFRKALSGRPALVDHHVSSLLHDRDRAVPAANPPRVGDYGIGIAEPIRSTEEDEQVLGVFYGLLNWSVIQEDLLDNYRGGQVFEGIGSEIYSSSYS